MLRERLEELCAKWETYVREQPDQGEDYSGYYAGHDDCAFQLRVVLNDIRQAAHPPASSEVERIARVISKSYGEDPDENAPLSRICGPNNEPLPCWMAYEEQAKDVASLQSVPVAQNEPARDALASGETGEAEEERFHLWWSTSLRDVSYGDNAIAEQAALAGWSARAALQPVPVAQDRGEVEALRTSTTTSLTEAVSALSEHIERYHDHEEVSDERENLRGIQHHLEGAALTRVLSKIPTASSASNIQSGAEKLIKIIEHATPSPASGETQEARPSLDMPAFIEGLRERAKNARAEKTATAIGDAMCFERSADALEAANAKVAQAERERNALRAAHAIVAEDANEAEKELEETQGRLSKAEASRRWHRQKRHGAEARIAELDAKLATAAEDGLDNLYSDALYDRDNSSDEKERALGSYASDWLHSAGAMLPADRLASRSRNGGREA